MVNPVWLLLLYSTTFRLPKSSRKPYLPEVETPSHVFCVSSRKKINLSIIYVGNKKNKDRLLLKDL